jgi:outer membrane lipoprotein carrier protein
MPVKSLVSLLFAINAFAAQAASTKDLEKVLTAYRSAKALQANVTKTVDQETLGTSTKSEGQFYFSKGKLRLEMNEPEKTLLVYDGKTVWFESRVDEEHIVVTKIKSKDLTKGNSLLAGLFDKKNVLQSFKLKSSKKDGKGEAFHFDAKDKKADVQKLDILLKGKDLKTISYKDSVENRVTLDFSNMKKGKVNTDKFTYKAPKHAEVQEL